MRRHHRRGGSPIRRAVRWGWSYAPQVTVNTGVATGFWLAGSASGIQSVGIPNFFSDDTVIRMLPMVNVSLAAPGAHQGGAFYCGIIAWDQAGSSASLPNLVPDARDGAWDWMWRWPCEYVVNTAGTQLTNWNTFMGGSSNAYGDVKSQRKMGSDKGLLFVATNYSTQNADMYVDVRFAIKQAW